MKLKNYELVPTEDGSTTLYSKLYNEACHSLSGAKKETIIHYIKGCEIENKDTPVNIFEVGFGTGLGYLTTKEFLSDFTFYSVEIDPDLIENYSCEFIKEKFEDLVVYKLGNLIIFCCDASLSIQSIKKYLESKNIHAIYQDAFSPKRNAHLWTVEWFEFLEKISHEDVIMSTYSSSSSIRKSMIEAGWKLYEGEKFGTKKSSTRARLKGETSTSISDTLARSPAVSIRYETADQYMKNKS